MRSTFFGCFRFVTLADSSNVWSNLQLLGRSIVQNESVERRMRKVKLGSEMQQQLLGKVCGVPPGLVPKCSPKPLRLTSNNVVAFWLWGTLAFFFLLLNNHFGFLHGFHLSPFLLQLLLFSQLSLPFQRFKNLLHQDFFKKQENDDDHIQKVRTFAAARHFKAPLSICAIGAVTLCTCKRVKTQQKERNKDQTFALHQSNNFVDCAHNLSNVWLLQNLSGESVQGAREKTIQPPNLFRELFQVCCSFHHHREVFFGQLLSLGQILGVNSTSSCHGNWRRRSRSNKPNWFGLSKRGGGKKD